MTAYVPAHAGRLVTSHEPRVLHVRGIGYVTRIDVYASGRRVRTVGASRMGARDLQVTRYSR